MTTTKRGPGRPRLDPTGKQKPVSVKLTDREKRHLQKKFGSVNKGFRAWIATECPPVRTGFRTESDISAPVSNAG